MQNAGTSEDAEVAVVRALTDLNAQLSAAADAPTFLFVLMRHLSRFGAAAAQIAQLHCDAEGVPLKFQYTYGWRRGDGQAAPLAETLSATPQPLTDDPLIQQCIRTPGAPLLVPQVATLSGSKALLPLYRDRFGGWQSLLIFTWDSPHDFSPLERSLYELLLPMLTNEVGSFRAQRRLSAALADTTRMYKQTLCETQEQRELLQNILDHIPVGVVLVDGQTGERLLGNSWLDKLFARELDKTSSCTELVRKYHFLYPDTDQLLDPQDLPSQRARRTGKVSVSEVDYVLDGDPRRFNVEATGVPIFDEKGAINRLLVLVTDLTARKAAERARLQDELIRAQAVALIERSSPLIPITDEILVLPLIGAIDTERGQQVLELVLQGSSERRARVTIIDITGVRALDTQAASTITKAAQALRLLGVEPVLTGIRAEVAQTLVGLGVELNQLTTRSTLQAGIQYALHRLGKSSFAGR